MKNIFFAVFMFVIAAALAATGCSSRELTKFSDNTTCPTTIEGNYFNELISDSSSLQLMIGLQNTSNRRYAELILQPNEPFAYCIDPGEYKVLLLKFIRYKTIEDRGYDLPNITLNLEEGKVNYIGNLLVDYKKKTDENVIAVSCRRNNTERSAALGMFGLVGAVANAIATEVDSDDLFHIVHFERDDNFLPEANKPILDVVISVNPE